MIKDVNGQILCDGVEVRRWALTACDLSQTSHRQAGPECRRCQGGKYHVVRNWSMKVLEDLNEREISLEEVGEAVNEMKSAKAIGLDGSLVESLKKGVYQCWNG